MNELDPKLASADSASTRVSVPSVEYDVGKAAFAEEKNIFPNVYANSLREGK